MSKQSTAMVPVKNEDVEEMPNALSIFVMQLIIDKLMKYLESDTYADEIVVTEIPLASPPLKSKGRDQYDYDL